MFSAIKSRLTYTNVAVTAALVFAMTGGAYAAKHWVITSSKQIKPSVLKQLKGARGSAGPEGKQGLPGANGKDGLPGASGEKGAPGESVSAKVVPSGSACGSEAGVEYTLGGKTVTICNGKTGFTDKLPAGKTETGSWIAFTTEEAYIPLSFNIPLSVELGASEVHVVEAGTTSPPPQCPGSAAEPSAVAGNLCVYVGENISELGEVAAINQPLRLSPPIPGAGTTGAYLQVALKGGNAFLAGMVGTWALTAPE